MSGFEPCDDGVCKEKNKPWAFEFEVWSGCYEEWVGMRSTFDHSATRRWTYHGIGLKNLAFETPRNTLQGFFPGASI